MSKKHKGAFLSFDSLTYKLFQALPILPEPAISRKDLAEKLGISLKDCHNTINRLPSDIPVYESDDNMLGRIK